MNELTLRVNGQNHKVAVDDPDTPLLYALRDDLRLRGPKFGCGLGQCGACTVLVDGEASRSCVTRALDVEGRQITTLEGLGSPDQPSRLQAAFIAEQAAQCGYCNPDRQDQHEHNRGEKDEIGQCHRGVQCLPAETTLLYKVHYVKNHMRQ